MYIYDASGSVRTSHGYMSFDLNSGTFLTNRICNLAAITEYTYFGIGITASIDNTGVYLAGALGTTNSITT
jgi:hypothetical protein